MTEAVYTIGHSTHSVDRFLELLKVGSIEVVGDVRSRPYSRQNPQFNRESLKQVLADWGIKYVFLGEELGARSSDPNCYIEGQVQYDLLARTDLFRKGITRVKEGARSYRVALMCAEKEPLDCHRTILVARELIAQGLNVKHILADRRIEDQAHALDRLIEALRIPQNDMFRSRSAIEFDAYALRGKEIAYRGEPQELSLQCSPSTPRAQGAGR